MSLNLNQNDEQQQIMIVDEKVEPGAPTTILDLPDDCLIHIFSKIDFQSLLATHRSTVHFQRAAEYLFWQKFHRIEVAHEGVNCFTVEPITDGFVDTSKIKIISYDDVVRIFKTCGKYMSTLNICGQSKGDQSDWLPIFYLAIQFCSERLKSLGLMRIPAIKRLDLNEFHAFLGQLESLRFDNSREYRAKAPEFSSIEDFINLCGNIKNLSISGYKCGYGVFLRRIPATVQNFSVRFESCDVKTESVHEFLKQHQNLKVMKFTNLCMVKKDYLDHLDNVKALRIENYDLEPMSDSTRLFQLKSLKHLQLHLSTYYSPFFSPMAILSPSPKPITHLESLAIEAHPYKELLYVLSSFTFTNLKRLIILGSERKSPAQPVLIAPENFQNLEELCFRYFTMDIVEEFVRQARSLKLLRLYYSRFTLHDIIQLAKIQQVKGTVLTVECYRDQKSKADILKHIPRRHPRHRNYINADILKFRYTNKFREYFDFYVEDLNNFI